jgi:hemerythrin-like metal-binding protein
MVEYNYPRIEEQRQEHAEFSRVASELKSRIELEGITREMAIEMSGKLFRWVVQHIKNHDRDMVNYVKKQIGTAA